MSEAKGLHVIDYCIFAAVLATSFGIGIYHAFTGGKQRSPKEYLMGNRRMNTIPVALSMLVSFLSGILVLGTPAEMYTKGTQLFMKIIGQSLGCLLSSLFIVPIFYHLSVTSSFEYLEVRFKSKITKLLGTISMLIGSIFHMGIVLYAPATALEAVSGLNLYMSICLVGIISTVYTALGGLRGVIWTDVFQAIIMIGGMLVIVIQGLFYVGGFQKVWSINNEGGRLIFFDFNIDPTQRLSFWSTVFGSSFSTLAIFGTGQTTVQRYCSLPTLTKAQLAVILNIPFLIIMNALASVTGLVIYAYYANIHCDPLESKQISNSNQLVPFFIAHVLNYPGLPGAFLAVLFSGALSSMSSTLNSCAAVAWEDLVSHFFSQKTENVKAVVIKILVAVFGILAFAMAFLPKLVGGHVLQASISFSGATMGPSLGMFLLGGLFCFANDKGAISGCIIASLFSLWLSIGAFIQKPHSDNLPTYTDMCYDNVTALQTSTLSNYNNSISMPYNYSTSIYGVDKMYEISFLWYNAIGCILTVLIGVVVSLIFRSESETNKSLLISCKYFACCNRKGVFDVQGQAVDGIFNEVDGDVIFTEDSLVTKL